MLKWGYSQIIQVMDDHDLVLKQPWWRPGIPHDLRHQVSRWDFTIPRLVLKRGWENPQTKWWVFHAMLDNRSSGETLAFDQPKYCHFSISNDVSAVQPKQSTPFGSSKPGLGVSHHTMTISGWFLPITMVVFGDDIYIYIYPPVIWQSYWKWPFIVSFPIIDGDIQ